MQFSLNEYLEELRPLINVYEGIVWALLNTQQFMFVQ